MILRALAVVALTSSVEFAVLPTAQAVPITSITTLNNFRDTRGLNDVGIRPSVWSAPARQSARTRVSTAREHREWAAPGALIAARVSLMRSGVTA